MKKVLLFFVYLIPFHLLFGQQITGTIQDENQQPFDGVTIYFDGTTIGTTTDADGFFQLNGNNLNNSVLVISYMGYETLYLNTFQSPLFIQLTPSAIALKEVVVGPQPFTRKEMLDVFKKQFLGMTKAGKSCKILNEEVIQLWYDTPKLQLQGSASEKIKIVNHFLGYEIEVDLVEFFVQYNKRTLSIDYQRNSYFAVSSFFKEMEVGAKTYDKNREKVYKGSSKHLFKNAIEKKWNKKEFTLFDGSFATNADLHFEISEELSMKKIKIKPKQEVKSSNLKTPFFRSFNLLYNNSDQSKVIFRTDEFFVDEFGNHSHIDQIEFSGVIAEKRFGDMLPLNYVP